MKLAVLSDLHFEFHADEGRSFVHGLNPYGIDVLVLAGDIDVGTRITLSLSLFCNHFEDAKVLYVPGNHERYKCGRGPFTHALDKAMRRNSNLHCMERRGMVNLHGHRFLGGTMWFDRDDVQGPPSFRSQLNDFDQIPAFTRWVFEENLQFRAFLHENLSPGDIVITHHLPAWASVPERFKTSPLNRYYLCDQELLIRSRKPAMWIHGHTHDSVDAMVGSTRVVANPLGYVGHETNPRFEEYCCFHITRDPADTTTTITKDAS